MFWIYIPFCLWSRRLSILVECPRKLLVLLQVQNNEESFQNGVVCYRDLVQYTKYKSVNTEDFSNRIARIVDCTEHGSNYKCGACITQVKQIEKFSAVQVDHERQKLAFCQKYLASKSQFCFQDVQLRVNFISHSRTKRMSVESPPLKSSTKARRSLGLLQVHQQRQSM